MYANILLCTQKKHVPRFLSFEALKDDDNDQIVPSMLCTIEEIELVQ